MNVSNQIYNPEADVWVSVNDTVFAIMKQMNCCYDDAIAYLLDSIDNNILYTYESYMEHFAPYENNEEVRT